MSAGVDVSVVLPFYNAESTLKRAVESILNQTLENIEVILVDNNSRDRSAEIASELCLQDDRCILISETKQGVMHAMNAGMRKASGRFIARMDADDVSLSDRLEKQLLFLEQNTDYGVVGGEVVHVGHNDQTAGLQIFVDWVNSFHSYEEISKYRFIEIPLVNPTMMFRRSLPEQFGAFRDGDFPEDYELQLRWLDAGVKMARLSHVVLEWHDSDNRLTRTDSRYNSDAFYRIKTCYLSKWIKEMNPFHPDVMIWGAGRKSRQRASYLTDFEINITGYVDVLPAKSRTNYLHYSQLGEPGENFILSYVGSRGARDKIREYLIQKGYVEGSDFLMMA